MEVVLLVETQSSSMVVCKVRTEWEQVSSVMIKHDNIKTSSR